ncbi:Gfo/Idh/MocA family oxidoreductase [Acetatifactor muris]|uniref:Putative oxidoreductase YhhX n=1 Tax=Acetatifactor muris TaxID=879566 RepID=A0A2K4ZPI3_9FIRM|nr:Gfo/Idh/MocA family oxidoreductase [Acetatifactor muris]MCR2050872.1 Gfo/Idh/MocA family oxidoreductase [Acetatifactor muris]SOY32408.1 putative oxidoreductase YhhX [Acetatifactor muris]
MGKKYTMGVLGLGEGRSIISAVLNSDLWDLGCICDLSEELCKERCQEFSITNYTTDYNEMLRNPLIEVIGIYTPDQLHATHIKMALEAGKHVICTKPLMVSLEEANTLLAVQKRTGKTVFVGQSSRYFEPLRRQHMDYMVGKHGDLVTLEAHYISDSRWFLERDWSRQKGFSWMYNFMIHAVDLAAWYLPEIEEVYGMAAVSANTKAYGLEIPDTLKFLLKDKSGRFASVTGCYATPTLGSSVEQSISCTLRGTKGISRGGYPKLQYYTNFEPLEKTAGLQTFDELHPYFFRFEQESHHAGEYQNYIEHFATALHNGETPKPDLKEGIHTLAIMEAMDTSIRTGERVFVDDILKKHIITLD